MCCFIGSKMLQGRGGVGGGGYRLSCAEQKPYGISFTMAATKVHCSPGSVGISCPCVPVGCLISLFLSHTTDTIFRDEVNSEQD